MSSTLSRTLPRGLGARLGTLRRPALPRPRLPELVRTDPAIVFLGVVAAVAYAAYGIVQHAVYQTHGFDLGIFDQAIWHYSRLEAPASTIREVPNLLGDHFSPILILLAPLYWIWADPRMLIAAQGVLVAASIVPVFLFARDRIGRPAATLLAVAYALFWGISAGVAYDFHEVAFAPLLIALLVLFADRERWLEFWVSFGLLLAVKEDMALFAVFIGLYLLLRSQPRRAAIAIGVAVAWYEIATQVLMPHFAGGLGFQYWSYTQIGSGPVDALVNSIRYPGLVPHFLIDQPDKVRTTLYLLVPFLFLVLYSPLLVLAVPLIAERMLSTNSQFWGTRFHYSLAIAPVLAMGATDGLRNVLRSLRYESVGPVVAVLAAGAMVVGNYLLWERFPLSGERHASFFSPNGGQVTKRFDRALAKVPPQASVMAQEIFIPRLSRRSHVYEIRPETPITDYIVFDVSNYFYGGFPLESFSSLQRVVAQRQSRYDVIFDESGPNPNGGRDGVVVFRRKGLASQRG
jgi:uncharacterized membrane protein